MGHAKKYADADATAESLSLIAATLTVHGNRLAGLEQGQNELRADVADVRSSQARMETLIMKVLDGQAVLHQNDMELKRRLDALGAK